MSSNVVRYARIDLESCLNMIFSKQRGCILIFNSSAITVHFDMEEKKPSYQAHTVGATMVYVMVSYVMSTMDKEDSNRAH